MRTQPVSNCVSCKSIYVNDCNYNAAQKYAIENIKSNLNKDVETLKKKGYDILIEDNAVFNDEVSVSAVKIPRFAKNRSLNDRTKIFIGNFHDGLKTDDMYEKINDYETANKFANNIGKVLIGCVIASVLALVGKTYHDINKLNKTPAVQKAKTEIMQIPSNIK